MFYFNFCFIYSILLFLFEITATKHFKLGMLSFNAFLPEAGKEKKFDDVVIVYFFFVVFERLQGITIIHKTL